jgi:hypothetical protein
MRVRGVVEWRNLHIAYFVPLLAERYSVHELTAMIATYSSSEILFESD